MAPNTDNNFELQILHASDLEGGVSAPEDAPRFSAVVNGLESEFPDQTLILSSGDNYIPGPFFAASGDPSLDEVLGVASPGRGDIAIANAIGFQAAAFGNHEFDEGTSRVGSLIGADDDYPGTAFPYLSANLDFSTDENLAGFVVADGQEASSIPNSIAASTVITVDGEEIGIVGATTPLLPSISSPGDVTVLPADPEDLEALATEIQPAVDALTEQGVDKIILAAHLQQLANEQELAGFLQDVDVIIAGGSNTLLADETDPLRSGDEAAGPYPILTESASGDPLAIVNTDGNYSYVGRLVAEFDQNGLLIPGSIDPGISGAYATDEQGVENLRSALENPEVVAPDPEVVEIAAAIGEVIAQQDGNIFGSTEVFLNGERADVRTQETNFGNLSADANLATAQAVDDTVVVSIKNGGGIRASIGAIEPATGEPIPPAANPLAGKEAGEVSQLDIANSLRFNNALTLITVTADQLLQVVEYGVAATAPGETPGQFPQVGGIAFSFDASRDPGDRVLSLAIQDETGNVLDVIAQDSELVGDASRSFRVVTLNFLASGGDGYPFPEFVAADPEFANRVDLIGEEDANENGVLDEGEDLNQNGTLDGPVDIDPGSATFTDSGTEQDALAEFLAENFADEPFDLEDVGPGQDGRIQNLSERSDTVLSPAIAPAEAIELTAIGTYETGVFDESAAEIVDYDPQSQQLFVVNANDASIDVLDASDPTRPELADTIDVSPFGAVANSVDIFDGVIAVAVENEDTQSPGTVAFFDADGELLNSVNVGALPDMLTFTPDGQTVLVANEGEPNDEYTIDPEGSVSLIDVSAGIANITQDDVTTADFTAFNDQEDALTEAGVRIFGPNASVAQDLEPEYITVSEDSTTAWVALQENNALAELDIASGQIADILPLGFKDHSLEGNSLDVSDADDAINIANWPIFGMYQPDGIASYEVDGETFIITANEGDSRDYSVVIDEENDIEEVSFSEEAEVGELNLDPTAFPNAAELQADDALGGLLVTNANGDTDGDGDFDQLYAFGGRSFSIRSEDGSLVYDSGDDFEQITASLLPQDFNANNDENDSFDNRSNAKGPEPEGVTTGVIGDRTYAFIGLERVGGVMTYDVTDPTDPAFVQYINNRDFSVEFDPDEAAAGESDAWQEAGDLGPEGLTFISAEDSPNGSPLLVTANEVSGTTSIFEIANLLNGSSGQTTFDLARGDGTVTIRDFGGVGTGTNPSAGAIAAVDSLKFRGEGLTSENMRLSEVQGDLVITFRGVEDTRVVLQDFALEDLDNLPRLPGASANLGNILFEGQDQVQDSFDVVNADQTLERVFNPNTTTFLNDLDNTTKGRNNSQDDIRGRGGDDFLTGLSGNDILLGGSGFDTLFGSAGGDILRGGDDADFLAGGRGTDTLRGGAGADQFFILSKNGLPGGTDTIADLEVGVDFIGISGVAGVEEFADLNLVQQGDNTLIKASGTNLFRLNGIEATALNSSSFIFA